MFSFDFVTVAFLRTFIPSYDSLKSVESNDTSQVVSLPAAKKRMFNYNIKMCQTCANSSCYQLISEHFGENRVILLQTVAK